MTLQEILGANYKEGMTAEEIAAEIEKAQIVPKSQADKFASEAAKYRKEANTAKGTAQTLEDRVKELERNTSISGHVAKLTAMGMDAEMALATATAMADGDMEVVLTNQAKFTATLQQKAAGEKMKATPAPPAGGASAIPVDYAKELAAAQQSGDMARYAALVTQQFAADHPAQ